MWWIIGLIILVIILYFIAGQRNFVKTKENIDNAFSQIRVNQQSRFDALTELAKATKSYSEYEYETLMGVIEKRQGVDSISNVEQNEEVLRKATGMINALAERYPDLKSSNLYAETMQSVNKYENNVRTARMVFNDSVTIYNRMVKQFPSSIVASVLGYKPENYLDIEAGKESMPNLEYK